MPRYSKFHTKCILISDLRVKGIVLFFVSCILLYGIGEGTNLFSLPTELLDSAESQYGVQAKRRLIAWEKLIRDNSSGSDVEKLDKVNIFLVLQKNLWVKQAQ